MKSIRRPSFRAAALTASVLASLCLSAHAVEFRSADVHNLSLIHI